MKYNKQITIGYNAEGKRIRKWIHANSIPELNAKEKELLKHTDEALLPTTLFEDYAERWFRTYKANRETNTKEYYQTGLAKFTALHGIELSQIRRSNLQEIISENWEHPRTCDKLSDILGQIFRAAMADGLILRNPAEGLEVPKYTTTEKRILTPIEKQAIENADLPEQEKMFLMITRRLGLRPQETRALTRAAINFKDRTISITRATVFDQNEPELKGTKNHKHRTLPLPNDVLEALRAYVKDGRVLLFPDRNGNEMTKSVYRRFSERIFAAINAALGGDKNIDLLNGMTFYTLRHTRGTELYYLTQKGEISTKLAAYYMGHSEIVFLNTYSHIDENEENLEVLRTAMNL